MGLYMPTINPPVRQTPLAAALRPFKLDEVIGQKHLVGPGKAIRKMAEKKRAQSTILWGPPGTGKTSLVRALSKEIDALFFSINATNATVKELRETILAGKNATKAPFVFVDECLPWSTMVCVRIAGAVQLKPIGFLVENCVQCEVLSVDTTTNLAEWRPIISRHTTPPKPLVEITVGRMVLRCSEDHLVFTTNRGYVPARELGLDDDVCLQQNYLQEAHEYDKTQNLF